MEIEQTTLVLRNLWLSYFDTVDGKPVLTDRILSEASPKLNMVDSLLAFATTIRKEAGLRVGVERTELDVVLTISDRIKSEQATKLRFVIALTAEPVRDSSGAELVYAFRTHPDGGVDKKEFVLSYTSDPRRLVAVLAFLLHETIDVTFHKNYFLYRSLYWDQLINPIAKITPTEVEAKAPKYGKGDAVWVNDLWGGEYTSVVYINRPVLMTDPQRYWVQGSGGITSVSENDIQHLAVRAIATQLQDGETLPTLFSAEHLKYYLTPLGLEMHYANKESQHCEPDSIAGVLATLPEELTEKLVWVQHTSGLIKLWFDPQDKIPGPFQSWLMYIAQASLHLR